jgi:O-antigen/teichoic acid export membrane protein
MAFGIPLISMSLTRQLDKYFFVKDKKFIGKLIFQIFIIFHVMSLLLMSFLVITSYFITFPFEAYWVYILVFLSLSTSINVFIAVLLRNLQKVSLYALFLILQTIINIGLSVFFIVVLDYNYEGRFLGITIAALLTTSISLYLLYKYKWIEFQIDIKLLMKIWKVSLPMIPFGIATVVITMSDIVFIKEMCSIEIVGIYAIGLLFGKTIILVQSSVTNISEPWVLKQISVNTSDAIVKISYFIVVYHFVIFLLVFIMSYISYFAIDLMVDEKFHQGKEFVFIIMLGYAIRGLQMMFTPFLIYKDKTNFMALNTVFSAVLNLILNYHFILQYGAIGAAYATVTTFLLSYFSMVIYSQKIYPLTFKRINNDK